MRKALIIEQSVVQWQISTPLRDNICKTVNYLSQRSQERLATCDPLVNATRVSIFNPEFSEVEIELRLPKRECTKVFTFQDKLVFIDDYQSKKESGSRRVDLMDISTGQVSSLPDTIKARLFPDGVATENEIFVYETDVLSKSPDRFSKEVYEAALGRWSFLPPMFEERTRCAAVNIPDYGVLFIGGKGRNGSPLRSTELLTRQSAEVAGGGGEKWQWLPYIPMNKEHRGEPLAVYFQGRVYVVGCGEYVDAMEMLDVAAGSQWTSITFFSLPPDQRLRIESMARVGNELFVLGNEIEVINLNTTYVRLANFSIELNGDSKLTKWIRRKYGPCGKLQTVHLK
ncbi:unnamed protein product [Hymenolepis diminuta]|uniref:BACK domain-containing protein n=1 Tax=Hymenolepis diminuta TaxID=6216 RepID=A0A564Y608_HYMDI|nr:unnamed protein product [Hymenolepis diminuta]